jgi:hypothetical protein
LSVSAKLSSMQTQTLLIARYPVKAIVVGQLYKPIMETMTNLKIQ